MARKLQNAYTSVSTKKTPQTEKIPGSNQVQNNAGGYVFGLDKWEQVKRFLVIGTTGGTYYVNQRDLTLENANVVIDCIKEDGLRVLNMVLAISNSGRAPSNDPALFTLALITKFGSDEAIKAAYRALPEVARIGTHLFHFVEYREQFAGWGNGMKRAISRWYTDKDLDALAYQLIKYRQRDGWSHRDLLRLAHPKSNDPATRNVFDWIVSGAGRQSLPQLIHGYEYASSAETVEDTIRCIEEYGLPWEAVKTEHLNDKGVWSAILNSGKHGMPLMALVRNLGRFSKIGLTEPGTDDYKFILHKLSNDEAIEKSRIHPLAVLSALVTYSGGSGYRGKMEWDVDQGIRKVLNDMFYKSFGNVEPTGKNIVLALDVSYSMSGTFGGSVLSCAQAGAAMMMTIARTEELGSYRLVKFSSSGAPNKWGGISRKSGISPIKVGPHDSLDQVTNYAQDHNWGSTDCALPALTATEKGWDVDAFIVITDNETWDGNVHPVQAMAEYRQKLNKPDAKLIVVGMTSTGFSIADPNDPYSLDVVGFDTNTPNLISDFIRG